MKCFGVLEPGKKVGWLEKPAPSAGAFDAIVRPIAFSPCTSDVHNAFHVGEPPFMLGRVLGHEAVGVVESVGDSVLDFKPGDRVVIPAVTPPWRSVNAQGQFPQHAGGINRSFQFAFHIDGVFAELFRVPDADLNMALMPPEVTIEQAVMACDMMSTGFHAAELAEIAFGDTVAISGAGPVGLMATAGAALRGAGRIIAIDGREKSFELALQYGATDIVNYKDGDIVRRVRELSGQSGVDRVIIAGGDAESFKSAVRMVKPGGVVANVNFFTGEEFLPLPVLAWGSGLAHKRIVGGLCPGGRLRMEKLLRLITCGRIDPGRLITHRLYSLETAEEAFWLMVNKPPNLIKPIVFIGS